MRTPCRSVGHCLHPGRTYCWGMPCRHRCLQSSTGLLAWTQWRWCMQSNPPATRILPCTECIDCFPCQRRNIRGRNSCRQWMRRCRTCQQGMRCSQPTSLKAPSMCRNHSTRWIQTWCTARMWWADCIPCRCIGRPSHWQQSKSQRWARIRWGLSWCLADRACIRWRRPRW